MKEFIFKKIIIPIYYKYKGFEQIEILEKITKRDFYKYEELKKIQWQKFKHLLNHCYYNIPYYNSLFNKINLHPDDIENLDDILKIPKLSKNDIRNHMDILIDPSISQKKLIPDATSGSTGIPLKLFRTKKDMEYGFALRYRSNAWCGWNYWDKSAWFVSDTRHITELDKFKGRITLWIKRRLLIDTKKITKENMFEWARQIKKFKPAQIYGYSSLLANFSEFVVENNIKFEGIKGVFSTAEALNKRELISKAFNAPVFDQYGASEMPCIAHECTKGKMHLNIDEILVEFEDIENESDIKRLICTPLYVYGMPLLRYSLGDSVIMTEEKCDCGLPYPVIKLQIGRISDNIVSTKGKLVSGITVGWYLSEISNNINQYQIIQENYGNFTIKISLKNTDNEIIEIEIKKLLEELLEEENLTINFIYQDTIPPEKNGKFRPIISRIIENSIEKTRM